MKAKKKNVKKIRTSSKGQFQLSFIALPYITAELHLGRIMGTFLPADIDKRYNKIYTNSKCYLVSGLDCYGTAVYKELLESKKTLKEYLFEKEREFNSTLKKLNIDLKLNFKTASKAHKKYVNELFLKLKEQSSLEISKQKHLYCSNCRLTLVERLLENNEGANYQSINENQLLNKKPRIKPEIHNSYCTFCKSAPELKETKQIFLKYKHSPETTQWAAKNNLSESQKQISRTFPFGVKCNLYPELENIYYYVWLEALGSYPEMYERLGLEKVSCKYFYAKDNDYYHRMIYPNLLPSSKNREFLTTTNFNTYKRNYVLDQNEVKLSASKKNFLSLKDFDKENVDVLRFAMALNDPLANDTKISKPLLLSNCKIFINKFINFSNRLISNFISKKISYERKEITIDTNKYHLHMKKNNLKLALEQVLKIQSELSKALDFAQKGNHSDWQSLINNNIELWKMLEPYTPTTSKKIINKLKRLKKIVFCKSTFNIL